MSITEKILADHEARKDASGVAWFTREDMNRLGIQEALFTTMQDVQHDLRLKRSGQVVESEGCTNRWSIQDTDAVRGNPHSQPGSHDTMPTAIPRLAP